MEKTDGRPVPCGAYLIMRRLSYRGRGRGRYRNRGRFSVGFRRFWVCGGIFHGRGIGAMLKSSNGKSRQSGRRSVNDKVCDEVWDEVWNPRKGRAFHQPPRIVKSRTRTTTRTRTKPRKGRAFPQPSVSRGPRTLPVLLLLSMPRHTSSLSSSHTLSSTLRRKTLSRLLSASPISTQKGRSCPRYTRHPVSQPIPITSRPIPFSLTNPEAPRIIVHLARQTCCRHSAQGKRI